MNQSKTRIALAIATAAASALLLTGCSLTINTGDDHGMDMDHSHMGNNSSQYTAEDLMFAQMMIPHHQQAVDMGTLAETRASDPKVKTLAAQIKNEQAPEIKQMKTWLTAAGLSASPMGMHDGMGMGMLAPQQIKNLEDSTGAEFDKLYLEGMISHHEGAISMAKMVINSKNAEVAKLAKAIIDSQTKQIAYMKSLLGK